MENAIEIKNLTKTYKEFKLDHISFCVPKGAIVGLIGENGAGKSTTIKLLLELIHKEEGEINILGTTMQKGGAQLREHIGVVMDECNFPDNLKINDINQILSFTYKTWKSETFLDLVKKLDISASKRIKEYSRGMKMKLSIAVALSHDSKVLILDEATSGLDPIVREEILDVFLSFIQDEDHSILISSHIISDLEKICDYITFLHRGRILFFEEKDTLLSQYAIIKCSNKEYQSLDKKCVIGCRENAFGVEALVDKRRLGMNKFVMDRPTIEDIMLYYVKEK